MQQYKFLTVLVLILVLFSSRGEAQNKMLDKATKNSSSNTTSTSDRTYLNDDWKPTKKSSASYYLVKQFLENIVKVKGVPTYDYGISIKTEDTPLVRYLYNYYHLNDQLAFSVRVIALKENLHEFQYQGPAVWYNNEGNLLAKGTFQRGKLTSDYVEYDNEGSIKSTKKYVNGKIFNVKANVYKPLLGDWVIITRTSKSKESHLFNRYKSDGTMVIETKQYSTLLGKRNQLQSFSGQPKTYLWKYVATNANEGKIEIFFLDGRLLGKANLKINGNTITSTITQHIAPNLVGQKLTFKRVLEY